MPIIILLALISAGTLHAPAPPPAAPAATQAPTPAASRLVREGQALYEQGKLGEALIKFEEAIKGGASGGELFYQTGYCYKAVRQDAEKSREMMTKAAPLLETQIAASPAASLEPHYYLAAIYFNDLGDGARGQETARKAIALVESGAFRTATDGESLFQIGRLHSLAGEAEKGVAWYEKAWAALEKDRTPNRQYQLSTVEQLTSHYLKKNDYAGASRWFKRLLALEPGREQERLSAGIAMARAGQYKDAIETLRGFHDDVLATEANYIVRVLGRYLELGSPPIPADVAKLDEAALLERATQSAKKLGELRKTEDAARAKAEAEVKPPPPPAEGEGTVRRPVRPRAKRAKGAPARDPNKPVTYEEWSAGMNIVITPTPQATPPSPARIAAEKEFFTLMTEYVRRGKLLREMAVMRGLASLIFR